MDRTSRKMEGHASECGGIIKAPFRLKYVLLTCFVFSSSQISDEKESLQFMILVHVDEDINAPVSHKLTGTKPEIRTGSISSGWVVMRSLNQVHVSTTGLTWHHLTVKQL